MLLDPKGAAVPVGAVPNEEFTMWARKVTDE